MPSRRHAHANAGNTAHLAHCEPTLQLMESIARGIPEQVRLAKAEAWREGHCAANGNGYNAYYNPYLTLEETRQS